MPYRHRQDKQRWEREHRQQRNEKRRERRLNAVPPVVMPSPASDPTASGDSTTVEYTFAIGVLVLSFGLLFLMFAVWKVRKRKLISHPVPDPETLKDNCE
jgi:hypothetical protein